MAELSTVAETAGRYVHWGVVQVSVTNLAIIVAMLVVFVAAILVPFRGSRHERADGEGPRR